MKKLFESYPVFTASILSGMLWLLALAFNAAGWLVGFAYTPLLIALFFHVRKWRTAFLLLLISLEIAIGVYLILLSIQSWMILFALIFPSLLALLLSLLWLAAQRLEAPARIALAASGVASLDWGLTLTPMTAVISPSIALGGFPALLLPASLFGLPYVTFLIVGFNGLLAYFAHRLAIRAKPGRFVYAFMTLLFLSFAIPALLSFIKGKETRTIAVAAMDAGMTPGGFHHAPPELEAERQSLPSLQGRYWDLTKEASSKGAELYVWSEKFYPLDPLQDPTLKARIESAVDMLKMTIVITYSSWDNKNLAVPVFPESGFAVPYEKIRIAGIVGEKAEAGGARPIYSFAGAHFGLLICYDMHYEENARILTRLGAEAILVASNAASWRNSKGWVLRTASLRAAENRIGFAVATDAGSFIVAPSGKILAQTTGIPGYSLHELPLSGGGTIYTRWGHSVRWALPLGFFFILGYAASISKKKARAPRVPVAS